MIDNENQNTAEKESKILPNKTVNLLKNFIGTVVNNKNEINKNLKPEELRIIISTNEGTDKDFNSIKINNVSFDPAVTLRKNKEKYGELTRILNYTEEESRSLCVFGNTTFNMTPELNKGFKFSNFNLFEIYSLDAAKTVKYEFPPINKEESTKNILGIYSTKLNGNPHKFNKIIDFIDSIESRDSFWNYFEKIYLIFSVPNKEQIEKEYAIFPTKLKELNDSSKKNIKIVYYITPGRKDDSVIDLLDKSNNFNKGYFFVVDPKGLIFTIKDINKIGNYIDNLINKFKKEKESSEKEGKIQLQKSFYAFMKFLKRILDINYNFEIRYNFSIMVSFDNDYNLYLDRVKFERFNGIFRSKEYAKLKEIFKIIKPKDFKLDQIETEDVEIDFSDMNCFKCSKKIEDDKELYYCYICKTKYCYDCVKNQLSKKGKNRFIDPQHNLLFFKTRDKNVFLNLDKFKLGKNSFAESKSDSDFSNSHSAICNGCGNNLRNCARYLCVSCRPGLKRGGGFDDFCPSCIEHMMADDEKCKEIQDKCKENLYTCHYGKLRNTNITLQHEHKKHIYLMIAMEYSKAGYYDY